MRRMRGWQLGGLTLVATLMGCAPATRGSWQQIAPLTQARELPRLAFLADGRILVIGGGSELRATAERTTEIFDPRTNSWSEGPSLGVPRRDAEVVTLPNGALLAIGGSDGPTRSGTRSVDMLDPVNLTWRPVANMTAARIGHTATLLSDGRVLVVGGLDRPGSVLRTAELYIPSRDEWISVGELNEPRSLHHARLLADSTVLVFGGGSESDATHTAEAFNPRTMSWSYVGSMREPRWGFASGVLPDGRILAAGGRVPAKRGATIADDIMIILDGTEIYDPATRQWTPGPRMNIPRSMGLPNVELLTLPQRGLVFVGGRTYPAPYHGSMTVEYYDLRDQRWILLPPLRAGRSYQASVVLPDGSLLVVGGRGVEFLPLTEVERFIPR